MVFCLVAICLLCSAGAVGQAIGSGGGAAQMLVMNGTPQQATQAPMAPVQSLLERTANTSAHGERPLWELMPEPKFICLGDVAREIRKEHEAAKKAVVVWAN
jgi:hypothetical protein